MRKDIIIFIALVVIACIASWLVLGPWRYGAMM